MVKEIQIQIVLKSINVGSDFLILAHINKDDVIRVKKCKYHNSIPNTKPGIIIIALAIHDDNSMIL
jgi:hypothetical protein